MGKLRRLKKVRRALRGTHVEHAIVDEPQVLTGTVQTRPAKDWPAPGLYNQNELMKARFPR